MTSILTGDIVKSRKSDSSVWLEKLKTILNKFGKQPIDWEIFRGDSFQLEVPIEKALYVAFLLKAQLKQVDNIDVRIGIGIGSKDSKNLHITEANGEAYVNSGEVFDSLVKKQLIAIKTPWLALNEELNLALELALLTMNSWTKNSAEVFQLSIENPLLTQSEIGKKIGITQSNISERQKRAGYDAITKLEKRYRELIQQKTTLL
ncbi:transcriptional regulator [Tenacibaculum sp. HL-MS23]|uniref:transcriptional regulator n=1 Tax=Tenacibaculum sp. HL-MS23 TaxID=3077734 RepID=UPI0028FC1718|nr:transcriptional regulator [Tenacibaculum sp. HL-MS23]WNW02254.1 transcriptional regulator [Tenacibaculum sp. HL-MS23]